MTRAFICLLILSFFSSFASSPLTTFKASPNNSSSSHQTIIDTGLGPSADSTRTKRAEKDKYKGHVHTRAARFWGSLGLLGLSVFSMMILIATFVLGGFWIFVFLSPIIVGLCFFLLAKLNRKKDKEFSRKKNWLIGGSISILFMLVAFVLFFLNIF